MDCFTLAYQGLTSGLTLTLQHPLFPDRKPAVSVGGSYVLRDIVAQQGCDIVRGQDPNTALVYRASVEWYEPRIGKPLPLLRRANGHAAGSVIHLKIGLPAGVALRPTYDAGGKPLELRIYRGYTTDGEVVITDEYADEALVVLREGETLTAFYADGYVCAARQEAGRLTVHRFTRAETLAERISLAVGQLQLTAREDEKRRRFILAGMADLIHLAGNADERSELVRSFFFQLPERDLSLVRRKLEAILHLRDPQLALALTTKGGLYSTANVVPLKSLAPDTAVRRVAAEKRRREKSERDRALRMEMRGGTGGSGKRGQQKQGKKK